MGNRLWQCLREAWGVDLRAAAVGRFGVGLLLCFDIAVRAGDLSAFYTEGSAVEAGRVTVSHMGGALAASLYFAAGSLLLVRLLMVLSLVFAASLAVGYHTGASTFMSWLLLLSLQNRNLLVLNAGDDLLRMLLFWGMFVPWGRKWSVDAYFKEMMRLDGGKKPKEADDCWWIGVGAVAARLQLSWMYLESYIVKIGPQWISGDAVWFALNDEEFTTRIGHLVLALSPAWLLQWMSHFTLFLELALPLMLLCPIIPFLPLSSRSLSGRNGRKRWSGAAVASAAAVATVIAIHVGFGSCLEIGFFPYIPVVFASMFIPAVIMDYVERQLWPERPPEDSLTLSATPEQACLIKPLVSMLGLEEAVRFVVAPQATLCLSSRSCGEGVQLRHFWGVIGLVTASPFWKRLWRSRSSSMAEIYFQRKFFTARMASAVVLVIPGFLTALLLAVSMPVFLRLFIIMYALCLMGIIASPTVHSAVGEAVGRTMTTVLSLTSFRRLPPYTGRRNKRKRQVLCLIALVYVGFWVAIPYTHYQSPAWPYIKWAGSFFRLEQYWTMFAPEPPTTRGWWLAVAALETGEHQDLWQDKCGQVPYGSASTGTWEWIWVGGGGQDIIDVLLNALGWRSGSQCGHAAEIPPGGVRHERAAQPALLSSSFKNQRWRKFFMNMRQERFSPWAGEEYLRFLCHQRNTVPGLSKATSVRLEYVQQEITLPGEPAAEPVEYLVAFLECESLRFSAGGVLDEAGYHTP